MINPNNYFFLAVNIRREQELHHKASCPHMIPSIILRTMVGGSLNHSIVTRKDYAGKHLQRFVYGTSSKQYRCNHDAISLFSSIFVLLPLLVSTACRNHKTTSHLLTSSTLSYLVSYFFEYLCTCLDSRSKIEIMMPIGYHFAYFKILMEASDS